MTATDVVLEIVQTVFAGLLGYMVGMYVAGMDTRRKEKRLRQQLLDD